MTDCFGALDPGLSATVKKNVQPTLSAAQKKAAYIENAETEMRRLKALEEGLVAIGPENKAETDNETRLHAVDVVVKAGGKVVASYNTGDELAALRAKRTALEEYRECVRGG